MNKSPRRWLQFSLGTLLVALTGTAVWIGWLSSAVQRQREAVAAIQAAHGLIAYRHESAATGPGAVKATPPGPTWLRRVIGDDYFQTPVAVSVVGGRATDELLAQLPKLRRLESVEIAGPVTGAGLAQLERLPRLDRLLVGNRSLSDDDLEQLANVRQLKTLLIYCERVTDNGVSKLKELQQLKDLRLVCAISDSALPRLAAIRGLTSLTCTTHPKLARTLADPTSIDFRQVPVRDVLRYLEDLHAMEFRVNENTLSAARLDLDQISVSGTYKNIPLRDGLDQILRSHGLGWTSDADSIVITTAAAAEEGRRGLNALKKALPKLKVTADW